MADQLLRERQDAAIWNAIEAENFKQALKLVDKRLSKKHTDYLEALKIYIRSRSPLVTEKSAVLVHLEELPSRKTPIRDLDVISLYDEAWGEIFPSKQGSWPKTIGELRWQAVKASPKDEEASLKCFKECLANDDLDHARQIALLLERTFPNNHNYIFWNISAMFLYSISGSCPENQKRIWGPLALGQITKLATATRQANDVKKLPLKSIHTPQELLLLHRITREYGKTSQELEYVEDPQLGPDSFVAKGEWELWRFRLKLIEKDQQWQKLFEITSKLLQRARAKDASGNIMEPGMSDWSVWEAFIRSAKELPGHKQNAAVSAELEAHLNPDSGIDKSWRRNAFLAWVKFCFDLPTQFSVIPDGSGKGQMLNHCHIIVKYLQKFGDASTAYNDMRPYVERLDADERGELLTLLNKGEVFLRPTGGPLESETSTSSNQDLSTANAITQAVNACKLGYLLISALPEFDRNQSPLQKNSTIQPVCLICSNPCDECCLPCLTQLAQGALATYKTAINDNGRITKNLLTTDRHPADDICVIAAMCLAKLALASKHQNSEPMAASKTTYILQAASLLEFGWTHSKSNFQINLFLIRLYLYLGCGSLAMRAYQRLSLKQIQLDTLSSTLFDRISSQHPHKFSHSFESSTAINPLDLLKKQQKLYRGSRNHISKNVMTSFKNGNYNSIFELNEVSETLSRTLSGAMSVTETRRITRLSEPSKSLDSISDGYDILPPNPEDPETKLIDTNDYSSFPSFESSQGPRFENLVRFFPAPSAYRYRVDLFIEKLLRIITPTSIQDGEYSALVSWLHTYVDSKKSGGEEVGEITLPERLAGRVYKNMARIIRHACDKERWIEEGFETQLEVLNTSLQSNIGKLLALVEDLKDLVPPFSMPLHILYIAYDVGKAAVHFSHYLSRKEVTTHEKQTEAAKDAKDFGQQLLKAVADKAGIVKRGLDESGWIDKVLESALPESGEENSQISSTAAVVRDVLDENFLEEWAGLVVESWRDSVAGLSLLKPVGL